jgi:hypothetical protein
MQTKEEQKKEFSVFLERKFQMASDDEEINGAKRQNSGDL